MECLVLAESQALRTALCWQIEDLGADWRATPVTQAAQARTLLASRWIDAALLLPCAATRELLASLQESPLLAPPCIFGEGAPDGLPPPIPELPGLLDARRLAGQLPALSVLRLPQTIRLAHGMLLAVGIPPHLKAWDFLPEMAALTAVHPPLLTDLQHGLYPLAARRAGLSVAAVERRLRLCVESTWNHGRLDGLERFFGHSVDPERGKPTNREFLCRVQERLTLAAARLERHS